MYNWYEIGIFFQGLMIGYVITGLCSVRVFKFYCKRCEEFKKS